MYFDMLLLNNDRLYHGYLCPQKKEVIQRNNSITIYTFELVKKNVTLEEAASKQSDRSSQ